MVGKNRIVNKHGLKMVGLKRASGITKRTQSGHIFWNRGTGHIYIRLKSGWVLKGVSEDALNGMRGICIIYNGPMTMQEIADAIYEEYREEMTWREVAEENGWRVKE